MERVVLGKFIKEYSKKNKENNPYPVYSVTNSNGFCTEYFTKDVSSEDKRNYKIVPFGYFAYNPSRINVGSVDCQQKEPYVVVSPLYTVFSVSSDLDKNYLKYFFKSRYCSNLINSKVSGSVRNNLKFNILSTFELPYCSVEKQQQAVKQFENIKSLINCEVKQLSLLDELIKSRFNEMFSGSYVEKKWREVVTIINGKDYKNIPNFKGTYPIYGSGGYMNLRCDEYLTKENSVIIGRKGNVTNPIYVREKYWNVDTAFGIEPGISLNPVYFYYFTLTVDLKSMVTGATIPSLTKTQLLNLSIKVPPIRLQNEFAKFVGQIDKLKFVRPVLNGGLMHA